jgi:hypothetical protein
MPEALSKLLRSSIFMMGPMLGRFRRATVTYPGGCEIGLRPIELHLRGLAALGVVIREAHGMIYLDGENLRGGEVQLDFPSVGATENVMMAGVLARGVTRIHNAAREPEIADLERFINALGGRVSGAGSDTITVEGVDSLSGAIYRPITDRIVAGMVYLGMWQERVLKIAEEAHNKKHLLYFDNFLGLYQAGISSNSNLSIAGVLKPLIEKGHIRIVTEMTPEELRVFREIDRGLADMFHILPVREMNEGETQRILIWTMQRLELQHGCRFALESLPTLLDVQRRAGNETVFPGKASFTPRAAPNPKPSPLECGDAR